MRKVNIYRGKRGQDSPSVKLVQKKITEYINLIDNNGKETNKKEGNKFSEEFINKTVRQKHRKKKVKAGVEIINLITLEKFFKFRKTGGNIKIEATSESTPVKNEDDETIVDINSFNIIK